MIRSIVSLVGFTAAAIGFWAAAPGWELPYLLQWWHGALILAGLAVSATATLWLTANSRRPFTRAPLLVWLAIVGGMGVAALACVALFVVTLLSSGFDLTGLEGVPVVLVVAAIASIPVGLVVGAPAGWMFLVACQLRSSIAVYALTGGGAALGGALAGNRFIPLLLPVEPWVAITGSAALAMVGVLVIVAILRRADVPVMSSP